MASRLALSSDGVAALSERVLVFYDTKGERTGEHTLDKPAAHVARFGDEWLVLGEKQKHLARVAADQASSPFASGRAAILAFVVGRDDTVTVSRGDTIELWSRDDEKRWVAKGGPFTQSAIARDHVVALADDGALVFFSREKGEPMGALRLASTDPASEWRLAHVDGGIVVLALGEWLVWIDASTRKTVRRVRARARVLELAADGEHVAVAVEDGFIQAFRASNGEPRASIEIADEAQAVVLGTDTLYTLAGDNVRAWMRQSLDITEKIAAPVTTVVARGPIAAVGDRTGNVRVLALPDHGEVGSFSTGESVLGLHIAKDETIIAATSRAVLRFARPWHTPRPVALKSPPTAFAADAAYAFSGSQDGSVDVYDLEAGRHITTYALSSDDRITALVRLAGPSLVVGTGALDGRVLVVDVANAKVVHRLEPHDEAFGVTCLASDPRGRIVASGGDDGFVVLLDPAKGRTLARIRVSETPVAMAFEPTGRRLAIVCADGTAVIATFTAKGATLSDLGLRGATQVAWGEGLVFGFKDGRAEGGERHASPASIQA